MSSILASTRSVAAPTLILLSLGSCQAPEAAPLATASLLSAVSQRDASPAELGAALELAGLQPFALAPPTDEALRDPQRAEFWHACAWAWSPATRAARRQFQAVQARATSAGQPGPIQSSFETRELDDLGANTRLMLTFDLLGMLGLGSTAAARALASTETRAALNELEQATWTAQFEVDAARVRLAAARAARAQLDALHAEVAQEHVRIEILERNGRIARGALASARLAIGKLEQRREQLALDEARARAGLALAAGLAPDASALDVPGPSTLDVWISDLNDGFDVTEQPGSDLLERVPELRGLLLDYAIAEARLRETASRRWPSLSFGPHLLWSDPDFLLGAVLSSGLPWPGSLDGEIEAASLQREAARERVEDGLLAAQTDRQAARARHTAAQRLLAEGARPAADASARLWQAARARFAVDPGGLEAWAHALNERAQAVHGLELARAEAALTVLDVVRSDGPGLELPRLVADPLAEASR